MIDNGNPFKPTAPEVRRWCTFRCDGGWLGLDHEDHLVPCPECKPHLQRCRECGLIKPVIRTASGWQPGWHLCSGQVSQTGQPMPQGLRQVVHRRNPEPDAHGRPQP